MTYLKFRKKSLQNYALWLTIGSFSLISSACIQTGDSGDESNDSDDSISGVAAVNDAQAKSIAAFSNTLRPELLSMNCASCHGGVNAPQVNADPAITHQQLFSRNLISLTNPANSRIVLKIQAGHNGNGSAQSNRIRDAITEWNALLQPTTPPIADAPDPQTNDTINDVDQADSTPPPMPPVPPVPAPTVNTALTVVQNYCMNCHTSGQFGATRWGNISNYVELRAFAYADNNRIIPGDPNNSVLVRRMLHGPGDQSMPPFAPQNSKDQYQILYDWIASLDPAPNTTPPAPDNPPPTPSDAGNSGNAIAIASADKLRLGDRRLIKSILDDVFGPSVNEITTNLIMQKVLKFGGNCDPMNSYTHRSAVRCNEPGLAGTNRVVQVRSINLEGSAIPETFVTREGFRIKACQKIAFDNNDAISFVVNRVRGDNGVNSLATSPNMSVQEVIAAYQMFYPGRSPSSDITMKLKAVADRAQAAELTPIGANDKRFESWRYVMLTLCRVPDWQTE